jgi:hypothetical protein
MDNPETPVTQDEDKQIKEYTTRNIKKISNMDSME